MTETWKDVPGYEKFYQVSNTGRFRSKDREIRNNRGRCIKKSKILSLQVNNRGYLYFQIKTAGIRCKLYIHRAVAMAFVPNPLNKPQVNHIDSNPKNNKLENLEWVTHYENIHHAINKGRFDEHFKKTGKLLTLSNIALQKSVRGTNVKTGTVVQFISIQEAGRHFNNDVASICNCCMGKRQTAQGYKWEYA